LARRVSRTGELGPLVHPSDPAETSTVPSVALTPSGVATLVFDRGISSGDRTTVVRRLRLNSSLSAPTYLPYAGLGARPVSSRSGHVAFSLSPTDAGRAYLARVNPDGEVHLRRLAADLPGGEGASEVGLDRHGNAYAVVSSTEGDRAWVRVWRVGGRLTAARRLTPKGQEADWVRLRTDLSGDTMVLWADLRASGSSFTLRGRAWHDGRLGPVTNLGRLDGPEPPFGGELPSWSIGLDDDGDGVLAWEVWSDALTDTFVRARVVHRDGTFGPPRDLGGAGGAPMGCGGPGRRGEDDGMGSERRSLAPCQVTTR